MSHPASTVTAEAATDREVVRKRRYRRAAEVKVAANRKIFGERCDRCNAEVKISRAIYHFFKFIKGISCSHLFLFLPAIRAGSLFCRACDRLAALSAPEGCRSAFIFLDIKLLACVRDICCYGCFAIFVGKAGK